jgi:hypothetical protein
MKIRTFFIASLFSPYFLWIILKAISTNTTPTSLDNNSILHFLLEIIYIAYVMGIWGWAVPYTALVIGLIIWSKNKSGQKLQKTSLYTPFLLSFLVAVEIIIVFLLLSIFDGAKSFFQGFIVIFLIVPFIHLYAAIVVAPLGYVFVFFNLIILKLLIRFRVIKADEEIMTSVQ